MPKFEQHGVESSMTEFKQDAENMIFLEEHVPVTDILTRLSETSIALSRAAQVLRDDIRADLNDEEPENDHAIERLLDAYVDVQLCWKLVRCDIDLPFKETALRFQKVRQWRQKLEEKYREQVDSSQG